MSPSNHTSHVDTRSPERVFITGASRGLGLALATQYRARGAHVVGMARDVDVLQAALAPLGAEFLAADVATEDAEALAVRATSLAQGPFDIVIHAASTLGPLSDDAIDPMPRLDEL